MGELDGSARACPRCDSNKGDALRYTIKQIVQAAHERLRLEERGRHRSEHRVTRIGERYAARLLARSALPGVLLCCAHGLESGRKI